MTIFSILLIFSISPEALLQKIDNARAPENFESIIVMINHYPDGREIQYRMKSISKKDKGTYLEFLSPAREKGRKFLVVGDNLWMYVPGVSRIIRLSVKDNFMGSNFTNNDLMKSRFEGDYSPVSIDSTSIKNKYILSLKAKSSSVPYSKIEITVQKNEYTPKLILYYTLSGKLLRRMELNSIKDFDGYKIPTYMKMENLLTKNNYTIVRLESFIERKNIHNRIFNPDNLKR